MTNLGLSVDELLKTTRAVRRRLDFERPVSDDLLRECVESAIQAPTGSNVQGWHFMLVAVSVMGRTWRPLPPPEKQGAHRPPSTPKKTPGGKEGPAGGGKGPPQAKTP